MADRDRLRALHDATDEMLRSLELEHRAREAVRAARRLVPADAAALLLPDERGEYLVIRAQEGLSAEYTDRLRIPLDGARKQYRDAGEHLILDLPKDAIGDRELVRAEGLARALSLPLFRGTELIGGLSLYAKDPAREFAPDDIELAHILATNVATGITNSILFGQAVASRELQRQILDAVADGVVIAWAGGRYEANPPAQQILGVPAQGTLSALRAAVDVRYLSTGSAAGPVVHPLEHALRGETTSGEFTAAQRTSEERSEIHLHAAPVRGAGGRVVAGVMTLHDITDLREAEREREQFLSIVSHELRTPLTPLKALAQLVRGRTRRSRQQGSALDLDSLDRNLSAIERQVDRMNGLVNDLLSVSRAERGSLSMERVSFDLAGLLRDVVQRYMDATEEEGRHRFKVDAPEAFSAHGDQARIDQLLMNLVGNAVKYSPTGGEVRVALRRNDGSAEIAISDDGIGIPPDDLPRLGHPFVRGAGRAGTFAGMGVGLYVARIVAEAHSGSLALESEGDGKGTTVTVKLPL